MTLSEFRKFLKALRELKRNARLTRVELEARKIARFRDLVKFAQRSSPYYAKLIREQSIDPARCVPEDFPVLTKTDLIDNFDQIVTDRRITRHDVGEFLERSHDAHERYLGTYRVLESSGTSGQVAYFVYNEEDWARGMAQSVRAVPFDTGRSRSMPKFRRLRSAVYASVGGHFGGASTLAWWQHSAARFFLDFREFEVNRPLSDTVARLNAFQPDFLTGYTTGVKMLAEEQLAGRLHLTLMRVAIGGEVVTEGDLETIRAGFGCDIVTTYGSCDHIHMGSSRLGDRSMTLQDDDIIYEFADDHILTTNLFNRTMPLIRYRMNDVLELADQAPGSPYLQVKKVIGRAEMWARFVNASGVHDFVSALSISNMAAHGLQRFQMQITGESSFRFLVKLDSTVSDEQRQRALESVKSQLRTLLTAKNMTNVGFEVVVVDDIAVDPRTRKFRLVVAADTASAPDQVATS